MVRWYYQQRTENDMLQQIDQALGHLFDRLRRRQAARHAKWYGA